MSNPKAPRVRRPYPGGPKIPIGDDAGPAPEPTQELPVDRMRRLGADEDTVGYFQAVWDHLDEATRSEWLADMDVATDTELREEIASIDLGALPADASEFAAELQAVAGAGDDEDSDDGAVEGQVEERPDDAEPGTAEPTVDAVTGEQLAPMVEGRVQHEGGGYYSVWIGDDKVSGDTNVQGRDAAEERLADELDARLGS